MPLPADINTVYRLFIIELYVAVDNDESFVQCVVVFCVKDGYIINYLCCIVQWMSAKQLRFRTVLPVIMIITLFCNIMS